MASVRPPFALLSLAANVERHKIASGEPWLVLMCIEYPGSLDPMAAQQYLRLVRDTDPIIFDSGDGLGPQEYSPFNFSLGEFSQSSNGQVPELEISASNVMRVLQTVIEQYSGIVGANLSLYVVNAANPAGEPGLSMEFTVTKTVCDSKLVKISCGASSPLRRLFPFFMYRPDQCMWQYNGPELQAATAALVAIAPAGTTAMSLRPTPPGMQCAYQGSLATCSKTINGTNGCRAHNNLARFGGFPGIDTIGAAAASVA